MRLCETTGEDLQWLLTGVAARGTVVIAESRTRHREILTRLAGLLDRSPHLASAVEAFIELLAEGERLEPSPKATLPGAAGATSGASSGAWIPIFEPDAVPEVLPAASADAPFALAAPREGEAGPPSGIVPAQICEPAIAYAADALHAAHAVRWDRPGAGPALGLQLGSLARLLPQAFGVRVRDGAMAPMFLDTDAAIVVVGGEPRPGQPAVVRPRGRTARCRVWLGAQGDGVQLGRLSDGVVEQLPQAEVAWALRAVFRVALAA